MTTERLDVEKSALGSVLINEQNFDTLFRHVSFFHWRELPHRLIWGAMCRLRLDGERIDLLTLKDQLVRDGRLDSAGGPAYLSSLTDGVPRACDVAYCAQVIRGRE